MLWRRQPNGIVDNERAISQHVILLNCISKIGAFLYYGTFVTCKSKKKFFENLFFFCFCIISMDLDKKSIDAFNALQKKRKRMENHEKVFKSDDRKAKIITQKI